MPKGEGPGRPCLDLAGRTFGFLRVVTRLPEPLTGSDSKPLWLCYCHGCGGFACVSSHRLAQRGQMTCGCFRYYKSEVSKFRHSKRYRIILKSRAAAIRWKHKQRGKPRYGERTLRVQDDTGLGA